MKHITGPQLYTTLVNQWEIQSQIGKIQIVLGNITADYKGKDAIGDLLQEWLSAWLNAENIYFRTPINTQAFPDFYLVEKNHTGGYLELKTFNSDASSPAFDLANFDAYCTSLLTHPERLDADYLVLSYRMNNSKLTIAQVWLKKIWELTGPSKKDPIKLQVKRGQVYNIRPCSWYSTRSKFKPFESVNSFLDAIAATQHSYPQCDLYKDNWLQNVHNAYFAKTNKYL